MPILTAILVAASLAKAQDSWTLKAPDPATKLSWDVAVDASMAGQEHHASFTMGRVVKPAKDAGKPTVATFTWEKLKVDEQEGQEAPPMDLIVGTSGEILKAVDPDDDAYRLMLSPFVFVYPTKAITIGDKWTSTIKPSGDGPVVTYEYTAKQTDTVHLAKATEPANDVTALVISVKMTTAGKDAVGGEGSFWVSRAGRVLKFEMKLTNWSVPMAGAGAFDATIKAIAK